MCHGETATEGPAPRLVGVYDPDNWPGQPHTIGNYWPYATIVYDFINRSMPFLEPKSLTPDEVSSLGAKNGGGSRLVVAYMSIGEAEDYRYYWREDWVDDPPSWLADENPDWPGNYKVRYWDTDWQSIIYGTGDSYLGQILAAGFDGVYLDIIDAFEYFEEYGTAGLTGLRSRAPDGEKRSRSLTRQ